MKKTLSLKIGKSLFRFTEKSQESNKELGKKIFTELESLVHLYEDRNFQALLKRAGGLEAGKLMDLLEKTFSPKLEKSVQNILLLLIKNRETDLLPEVYETYKKLYFNRHHIADITIISARELRDEEQKSLLRQLESKKFPELHWKFLVNPDLIGGLQIYKNNILTDLSVKTYLEKLKHHLTSNEYAI